MSKKRVLKRLAVFSILLVSMGGLISCALPAPSPLPALAEAGPQAWIEGHAAYGGGIARIEIWTADWKGTPSI